MLVNQQLRELIDRARSSGDHDDFEELLRHLRTDGQTDAEAIRALARSDEDLLRRAALRLSDDADEESRAVLIELVNDHSPRVRQDLSELLADRTWWPVDHVVAQLLLDGEQDVRLPAVRAARPRAALEPRLVERLAVDDYWRVRQEIARVLGFFTPRAVAPVLLQVLAEDGDSDVQKECAASLERHLETLGGYPVDLARPRFTLLREAHARLERLGTSVCPMLAAWLQERIDLDVDLEELKKFGNVLTLEAQAGRLPHAYEIDAHVDEVFKTLSGKSPRAVVIVGDSGCGKTAIVYELAHRLAAEGWFVVRVAPADFLVGTVYLGEWETKLRQLVNAVKHPRKVILYVPNLEDLASVGMTSKSDSNVANALAPHIERGDVTIIGESTSESFRKGLGAIRSLRRLFHAVQLPATENDETREILRAVADESGLDVADAVLDRLLELADFYSSGTAQPGRSVGLLRRVLGAAAALQGPLTERHVLETISTSTGIPVDFLDDAVPLDRAKVRGHFESRVMGQGEAVEAVVDLVTLVKAGLTDPNKPFGVMLFVGPTGVGKTELARALAELLFGDPGRMVRLDMSEYATYEAYERLIGQGANPGLLTATVRERPFTVLLLDEIEKAHLNVFDLCLQIFDAGRLTDAQGRTADFRRTIVVMTSNVGSRIATETPVGFGRAAPPPPDSTVTMRELSRAFRPEFLNRIDRIVQFKPLSAETAEKIARREVDRVLERSGITRRKLTVHVEPSLLPLLLREGYSPAYGARPLKRTVERLVLLPAAKAIASGEAKPGSLLRLLARGNRVEVEVSPPETGETESDKTPLTPRSATVFEQCQRLREVVQRIRERAAPLSGRRSLLLEWLAAPGAWDDRATAEARSDEVFRIDGVLAKVGRLEQELRQIEEALQARRLPDRAAAKLQEQLDDLEGRGRLVGVLVACREARDLGDALVLLARIGPQRELDGVGKLGRMYRRLAERMDLEAVVLDDHRTTDPVEDVIALQITGAGAFVLLQREQGLHYVSQGRVEAEDGRRGSVREVIRVEVFATAGSEELPRTEMRAEVRPLPHVEGRLMERPRFEVHLSHQPTLTTVRAWTDRSRHEAVEQIRPLLQVRVAAQKGELTGVRVVRRYDLGPSPLVRDTLTGKKTGRVEEVFDGGLDQFLVPDLSEREPS